MEVQNRAGRNHRMHLILLTVERRLTKHSEAHKARVLHFQPNLGRAEIRIEGWTDIADPPLENHIRESVKTDFRVFVEVNEGQIVLVYVADNPYVGQVGNSKRVRRSQALRSAPASHLLVP